MTEMIAEVTRKARKPHRCDYCGETIEPGEVYVDTTLKYDGIYRWHSHKRCTEIATKVWDYADPDEGMTEDDFQETCHDVCRTFVCPDCENWNREFGDCEQDESYCTKRMAEFFKTHDLVRDRSAGNIYTWKCVECGKMDWMTDSNIQRVVNRLKEIGWHDTSEEEAARILQQEYNGQGDLDDALDRWEGSRNG